ncbi:MAG TPA: DUF3299 domain-containing protein, partial [Stenotrophomonas sp.]|nr:DUF3299 domain-containing protein [Stenotrophomonas sp.]
MPAAPAAAAPAPHAHAPVRSCSPAPPSRRGRASAGR